MTRVLAIALLALLTPACSFQSCTTWNLDRATLSKWFNITAPSPTSQSSTCQPPAAHTNGYQKER